MRRATLVLASSLSAGVAAFPDAPPPGHTGGFGEPTCAICHRGSLGGERPELDVTGFETPLVPGERRAIVLALSHPRLERAGFMLTVRSSDGAQAGCFEPSDGVLVDQALGIEYAHHSPAATWFDGEARWHLRWRAPTAPREVVAHLVVIAADGDESPLGDTILTFASTVEVASSEGARPLPPPIERGREAAMPMPLAGE
jgi:hypothetical protein